jgi:hypothetical protein
MVLILATAGRGRYAPAHTGAWYHHVNIMAHDRGGHFIPWEIPGEWVADLRRTFRGRR